MDDRRHLGSAFAGLLALLAVVVPVLVDELRGGTLFEGPVGWWFAIVGAYGALFAVLVSERLDSRADRLILALLTLLGLAAFATAPRFGFTAVLLVVTATSAAFVVRLRTTMVLVASQTLALGLALAAVGETEQALINALTFGGFQLFAVVTVEAGLREARARDRLARVNAELRAAQALLADSTRETERLRIARDLHDLVGHQLTALTLNLEVAAHHADGPARPHVERARTAAKALLRDVREAVGRLREPPGDLAASLRAVSAGLPRPAVHLDVAPGLAVNEPERATALVRCVQEVITNAVRHADADNLWIEVGPEPGGTRVRAWDDGRGTAGLRPGNGLDGMRERFEQLGGRVAFSSQPGRGFHVEGLLP